MSDALSACVGFTRVLRGAGLACGPDRVQAYLRAAEHVDLYWAGRLTLCADPDDLPRYDKAFQAWFGGDRPRQRPQVEVVVEQLRLGLAASDVEVLRHKDFSELTPQEREAFRRLLAQLNPVPPQRRARRLVKARRGRVDPRRTVRKMIEAGGETVLPRRRTRTRKPRKVVLLIDVSGSMSAYADGLLRFAHVLAKRMPVEVHTVGTRLTRVTRQLRERDPERAMRATARAIPDYEGGTRLGDTLRAFTRQWRQRGAVVVLFSDGWERGDPALLAEQLRRIRRVSHAVIWANPHAGKPGYRPVQSGIVAALPHVDRMVAGHSLHTLQLLLNEVRRA
ncbi:VWA domain-containing protein [Lentzea sp. NBRC 105346]|uniref:vWA domain-containing protein n=1 Tax=Lentzea sp. NBRC 105346 TaxID=3032205 RepID=UPI0024A538B3|nr:VWA domain-containing protein [Lentzea sp. NBRC 105346]GLZ32767.1 VWA domain-containing protein [Lentzea sp. NBRC 105346]